MKAIVTGCAGFLGSHLVDRLLNLGYEVVGIDNLSTGLLQFLFNAKQHHNFQFIKSDLLEPTTYQESFQSADIIFHFAANADVRFGTQHTRLDLEQNALVTYNVLECMRLYNVSKIVFSSTGSVYGDTEVIPTPEDAPFPIQTSFYSASKVAAESLITAYSEGFGIQALIFRFVSLLGERYTHGHVFDFYKQLKEHPDVLNVLGDGNQRKSYLYVHDCIDAIILSLNRVSARINLFNLGTDEYCAVNDSIRWILDELQLNPTINYAGGKRGWIGDNPFIYLDTKRICSLGWSPTLSIEASIKRTVAYLRSNEWTLSLRLIP